jgi:hypothetical protein
MTHAEQMLLKFFAYWDKLVRKGKESRLSNRDVGTLEQFMAWLEKHYILTERRKR